MGRDGAMGEVQGKLCSGGCHPLLAVWLVSSEATRSGILVLNFMPWAEGALSGECFPSLCSVPCTTEEKLHEFSKWREMNLKVLEFTCH